MVESEEEIGFGERMRGLRGWKLKTEDFVTKDLVVFVGGGEYSFCEQTDNFAK